MRLGASVLLIAMLAVVLLAERPQAAPAATGNGSPIRYLLKAQNPDGGFGMAPAQQSNTLATGWATLALAKAGLDPRDVRSKAGRNPLDYLIKTFSSEKGAGAIERTTLAVGSAGNKFADFGRLRSALAKIVGRNGSVGDQTNLTTFAVLAMRVAGVRVPAPTIAWLARQQDRDGGFNFATRGGQSDTDDTGAVLDALAGTGKAATVRRALGYLRVQQNRDGGFSDAPDASSNAQSTAFVICGLIGAGVKPVSVHHHGSPSPVAYLRSLIQPDGSVDYSRGIAQTPVWVTAQAEIALSGHTL
jgi:prenyltransferase beta subunit